MDKKKKEIDGGKGREQRLYSTEQAQALYLKCLDRNGFDASAPNLEAAWSSFKEMAGCSFKCADDGLLFEAGVNDFTGENLFYLSLVRQFTIEVDEEYDFMEQLYLEFTYPAGGEMDSLKEILWTYDFNDDFDQFIEAVENSEVFRILRERCTPVKFEIYQEEV